MVAWATFMTVVCLWCFWRVWRMDKNLKQAIAELDKAIARIEETAKWRLQESSSNI